MASDHSEYIDDYCRDNYGHTNWGYLDTYTKEELAKADHCLLYTSPSPRDRG